MKVRVDSSLCDGYGKCARICPEIFRLDEDGYASTHPDAEVAAALKQKVREALGACPTAAVVVEGE
ncbi:MAG: ferredoxin [Chloroflexota bacterium]|nr:ferredoxin [Chloroflexota bacterium]